MEVFILLVLMGLYIGLKVFMGGAADPIGRDKRKYKAGLRFIDNREFDKGFVYFNAMISENPRSASAWLYRGRCQQGLGNQYAAIADYTKASEIDYNVAEAFLLKAKLLLHLDEVEQALEAAEKAVWHLRNNGEAYTVRGEILAKLGQNGKAVMDFRKAISLGDENANFILRNQFNLQG
jgi:tetratricopeptide (TPR) repeat protein